jgi:hypothetical protein
MCAAQAVKCAAVLESMLPRESDFISFDVRLFFYVCCTGCEMRGSPGVHAAQRVQFKGKRGSQNKPVRCMHCNVRKEMLALPNLSPYKL